MSSLTRADLKDVRLAHSPARRGTICGWCLAEWPCRQIRLVTRVEELEAKIALALQQADYGARHGTPAQDALDSVLSALGWEP